MKALFSKTGHEADYMAWWLERQKDRQDSKLSIKDIDVCVRRTVFSPDPSETHSSLMLLESFPKLKGKSFLDIGGGCGILSLYAAYQQAAKILTIDSDAEAIANSRENFRHHNIPSSKAVVLQGDVFNNLQEKFDVIVGNLPIIDIAWPQIKEGTYNTYVRFLRELPSFLTEDGVCYLSFASFGDIAGFDKLIRSQKLQFEVRNERKFDVNWYVLQLRL
jgi:16S rRNA G1207 methylase RsmC